MKRKILISILILFIFHTLSLAQDFGSAIVVSHSDLSATYGTNFIQAFRKSLVKDGLIDFQFYTWNKGNNTPEQYAPLMNDSIKEQPITTVAYIEANLKGFDEFSLSSEIDKAGKITGYYLNLTQSSSPKFKVIHLPTAEVLISEVPSSIEIKKGEKIRIGDYVKYSKTRPELLLKSNKKLYDEILVKIKKTNQSTIKRIFDNTIDETISTLKSASMILSSRSDTHLWSIVDAAQAQAKKLNEFWIDASDRDRIKPGQLINVFAKQTYGDINIYEQLTIAGVTVEQVTTSKTLVKTNIFNRKKIQDAINDGFEIILARNPRLLRSANVTAEEYKRIQVKSDCFTCAIQLESILSRIPNVKLIERQFDPVINYFTEQYTDDKFIDYNMERIQGIAEGADYLFEVSSNGIQATDVASGRIERIDKKEKKGFIAEVFLGGTDPADILNMSLDILDFKLELLEITSAKKGKAEKVRLYSPVGFGKTWKVKVVREVKEEVGGRSMIREEEVGSLSGRAEKTYSVKDYKVKAGEREIYEAEESGEKLKFIFQ